MSRDLGVKQTNYRVGPCGIFGTIPYAQESWNFAAGFGGGSKSRCDSAQIGCLYGAIIGTETFGCPAATAGRILDTFLWAAFCCNKGPCGEIASSPCGVTTAMGSADLVSCKASPCTSILSIATGSIPGAIVGGTAGAIYGACTYGMR